MQTARRMLGRKSRGSWRGESNYYYHGCSRVSKRRRGSTDYCSPIIIDAAPLHFRRPSSQQEDAQTQTGGSSTDKKPIKGSTTEPPSQQTNPNNPQTDGDGENLLAPSTSSGENNCPPRYRIPICPTSKLLEQDPTQEGGWWREPWDESAASDVLFQQDFLPDPFVTFQKPTLRHFNSKMSSSHTLILTISVALLRIGYLPSSL